MSGHDLAWRAAGITMMVAGAASTAIADVALGVTLAGFALAIAGVILAVQGDRVPLAIRIERSRHRDLPARVHARRVRRRSPG